MGPCRLHSHEARFVEQDAGPPRSVLHELALDEPFAGELRFQNDLHAPARHLVVLLHCQRRAVGAVCDEQREVAIVQNVLLVAVEEEPLDEFSGAVQVGLAMTRNRGGRLRETRYQRKDVVPHAVFGELRAQTAILNTSMIDKHERRSLLRHLGTPQDN